MPEGWLVLESGVPDPPPDPAKWAALPGPYKFLEALFEGADVSRFTELSRTETPRDIRTVAGLCGSEHVGYWRREITSLEAAAFPMRCKVVTHGLQGIDVDWTFSLEHLGRLGHAGFRSARLRVKFADADARARFAGVWRRVFGLEPRFTPEDTSGRTAETL